MVSRKIRVTEKSWNCHTVYTLTSIFQSRYNFFSVRLLLHIIHIFDWRHIVLFLARSKFPRLDDILENSGDPKKKAKLIEGYKFSLSQEIIKDFGKAFGCPKETIIAFVNQEVKHEGKCEKCWIMIDDGDIMKKDYFVLLVSENKWWWSKIWNLAPFKVHFLFWNLYSISNLNSL